MESYRELRDRQQKEFNELPLGFAFSDKQFDEMMGKWGLDPEKDLDKIYRIPGGGFIQKKDHKHFHEVLDRHNAEMEAAKTADEDGTGFLYQMFRDEPDNNKLNAVLDLADAYAEHEYEKRKKSEKVQWGKDVCAAAGESVDELPEKVFISISEKLEDRMLEDNGDLEYAVVQEVVNEFWEQEEEEDADCKPE